MRFTALLMIAALLVVSSCGTPATTSVTTASPSATEALPSASVSPRASAPLTPSDFVLPQNCSYVGGGAADVTISTLVTWEVNCGAAPDLQFVEKMTPVFAQQGWTVCFIVGGRGAWSKGPTQSVVSQSAVGYPTLSQLPRQTQDCPPPTTYVNTEYKFSVLLPSPYRKSERLSLPTTGQQRPAAHDAFTARTEADEVAVTGMGCQTACPIWNYVAVVIINTGARAQTPRDWYTSAGGAVGQTIEDVTVDGRPAIKVTNGSRFELQYLVKDGDRMIEFAYQTYPSFSPVPVGAARDKLQQILTSFRFIP